MRPFWSGFALCLSVCLDLGIVNVGILRTALRRGGRAGFLVGLGSCGGDLVYFGLAAAGATALLRYPAARWTLWIVGTAVLLFLAFRMLREVIRPHAIAVEGGDTPESAGRALGWGLSLALASPTSILWFAAVGGSVIASFAGERRVLLPFAAGFAAGGVAWSALLAFGAAATTRLLGDKLVRIFSLVSALLFVYFAVMVFRDGWRELL